MDYLDNSDVDFSAATATNIPIITAGTGRGKTTYSVDGRLRRHYEQVTGYKAARYIVVTPLRATANQVESRFIVWILGKEPEDDQRVIFGTHSKLCGLMAEGFDLTNALIVIDEIHRFILNTSYQEQTAYLVSWMMDREKLERCRFVGLSATPQILFDYLNRDPDLPFRFYDATKGDRSRLKTDRGLFISHGSLQTYAETITESSGKKLLYVRSAASCEKISRSLNDRGIRSAFVISEGHKNGSLVDLMNRDRYEGLTIREYLETKKDLPPEVQVLIINDSFSEGADIEDKGNLINEVVAESVYIADIQQIRSRVRHNISQLTVIYNNSELQRTIDKLSEVDDFLSIYQALGGSARKEVLERRLAMQDKNENALLVVLDSGSNRFLNPFIESITRYQIDRYIYAPKRR